MTKDMWNTDYEKHARKLYEFFITTKASPEIWQEERAILINFIDQIDQSTEVYFMEQEKSLS